MSAAVLAQIAAEPPGSAEFWVFLLIGALSLGSALAMVLMRNAVHAALMLVLNFFTIAVLYAVLEAQFLAVVQIIVYAGAIMVLFLFVIMLLGVDRTEPVTRKLPGQGPLAVLFGILLFGALSASVVAPFIGPGSVCGAAAGVDAGGGGLPCAGLAAANEGGNVEGIGALLFTDFVWPFEVTSVLLVIAALGAIVLGRQDEKAEDLVDVVRDPANPPDEERR
ncbi:MAG: NADH-quinone oxidoreductase subunit J [Euzebyales bacterium]|nr:NADH-quinone oxidoreductase subunit J [Euzebyales bacterium]